VHGKEISFDDRILTVDDNVSSLLQLYVEKLMSFLKDLESR